MKVRYLVGSLAGQIVDMPTHAAQADVQFGFAEWVKDEKPNPSEETPVVRSLSEPNNETKNDEVTPPSSISEPANVDASQPASESVNEPADTEPTNIDPAANDSGSVQESRKSGANRYRRR